MAVPWRTGMSAPGQEQKLGSCQSFPLLPRKPTYPFFTLRLYEVLEFGPERLGQMPQGPQGDLSTGVSEGRPYSSLTHSARVCTGERQNHTVALTLAAVSAAEVDRTEKWYEAMTHVLYSVV